MKVLIVHPRRDPSSPVRTQIDMRKHYELSGWPDSYRGYGLYLNVLDTLGTAGALLERHAESPGLLGSSG
jgi:hypothetical protein